MTRRILYFGIGAMAFSLPACMTVGSDLPPHLRPNGVSPQPDTAGTGAAPRGPFTAAAMPAPAARPVFQPAYITDPTPTAAVKPVQRTDPAIQRTTYDQKPIEIPRPELADVVAPPKNAKEEPTGAEPPPPPNVVAPEWPELKSDNGVMGPAAYSSENCKPRETNGQAAKLELPRPGTASVVPTVQSAAPETGGIPTIKLPNVGIAIVPPAPAQAPVPEVQPPVAEIKPPPAPLPKLPPDSPLVKAVRYLQLHKHEEALDALRQFDPATQELLSNLIQPLVRLSETPVQGMNPDEAALLVEQFTAVSDLLKTKAALTAGRICYCNGFRRYGDIDEDLRPAFQPGSTARVYVEIKNFLAEPALLPGRSAYESQRRGYRIRLLGHWELRDAGNRVVYSEQDTERKDLNWVTPHITPPQDYWQIYGIPVPSNLRPGSYTLWIQVTDVPTGRTFRRPIEFRIAG